MPDPVPVPSGALHGSGPPPRVGPFRLDGLAGFESCLAGVRRTVHRTLQSDKRARKGLTLSQYWKIPSELHGSLSTGAETFRRITKCFEYFSFTPTSYQSRFIRLFLESCLHSIYKGEFNTNRDRILQDHHVKEYNSKCVVALPRQRGKSTGLGMLVAALLFAVRGQRIAVCSTGQRASDNMRQIIMQHFHEIPGATGMVTRRNKETIEVNAEKGNEATKTTLLLLPDSPDKIRGLRADYIVNDEANFQSIDMFFDVIVPLLQVESRAYMAVSSVKNTVFNVYTELFKLRRKDGTLVFKNFRIDLMCAECKSLALKRWVGGASGGR